MQFDDLWHRHGMSALAFGIIFIAFFLNLGGVPLFDLDEGAFAEATREMLVSGVYSATYLDGQPRYDKPIFSYWMQAISIALFGLNEWAVRLPSAIAGCLWLAVGYRFVKQQFDQQSALYFVMMMALVLWVMIIARAGTADAWLNLFITLTVINIWRYRQQPTQKHLLFTYFWMALGVLTKGPVAILVPLLTAVISFLLQQQRTILLRALFSPAGWAVFLAVVSPWLVLVYQEQGIGFFHGFLFEHNLQRFSATKEQHGGIWYYYLLLLPVILLPFSGGYFAIIKQARTLFSKPLEQFLLIWFVVVLVLVSMSKTQLPHYVLYGITGLVMILAGHRQNLLTRHWHFVLPVMFMVFLTLLPTLLDAVVTGATNQVANAELSYDMAVLSQYPLFFDRQYQILAGLCLMVILAACFIPRWSVVNRLILIGAVQGVFMFCVVIEGIAFLQQKPVYDAAMFSKNQNKPVVAFQIRMPSFSVYRQQITPSQPPKLGDRVFTKVDKLTALQHKLPDAQLDVVYRQGGILLVDVNPPEKNNDSASALVTLTNQPSL